MEAAAPTPSDKESHCWVQAAPGLWAENAELQGDERGRNSGRGVRGGSNEWAGLLLKTRKRRERQE